MIRTVTRIHVFGRLYADDACVYFALAMLIATGVLYNYITPIMFEFEYTFHKEKEAAAGFKERVEFFLRLQFAIIVLFWTTIWAVKLSFLLWYRKMLVGFTDRKILWPFVLIFSLCAYLGCWVTQLESCQPISHYFTLGMFNLLSEIKFLAAC